MMKLMRAPNVLIGQHWINVLSAAGISCELHNRYLNGALGEIPAEQCAPELWLVDERDEMLARKLIEAASNGPAAGTPPDSARPRTRPRNDDHDHHDHWDPRTFDDSGHCTLSSLRLYECSMTY